MKLVRSLVRIAAVLVLALGALLVLGDMARTATDAWGRAYVVDAPERLPRVDAVLVLGTAYGPLGEGRGTFAYRIDAAAGLWHSGLADKFLVSGNRLDDSYDEPAAMRDELVARGVPATVIELDPLGRRTWDSVRRARDVYGKRRLVIVSQRDHLARALFLARHIGLEAWGVAARGSNYDGLYHGMIGDLASLAAYYDVLKGAPPRVIAAGSPR
jgi:SanA protein